MVKESHFRLIFLTCETMIRELRDCILPCLNQIHRKQWGTLCRSFDGSFNFMSTCSESLDPSSIFCIHTYHNGRQTWFPHGLFSPVFIQTSLSPCLRVAAWMPHLVIKGMEKLIIIENKIQFINFDYHFTY